MEQAVEYIRRQTDREPRAAVVLGSGLGAFADELSDRIEIPYSDIPEWPASTAVGHAGKLVFGKHEDVEIAYWPAAAIFTKVTRRRRLPSEFACCAG